MSRRMSPSPSISITDQQNLQAIATPFSLENSLISLEACLEDLPASITSQEGAFRPRRDVTAYLRSELLTWKIDRISQHLWFAWGRHMRARSLHRHRITRHEIVITESPSEHLVSDYTVVFLKPLPAYLLCHEFWRVHLSGNQALHSAACGFVLSYTWLVVYKTDFTIGKEMGLLPEGLTWNEWTRFVSDFLDRLEASPKQLISERYKYGELRMSRLNYIYKAFPSLWVRGDPGRGFMPTSMWNKSFTERNIARFLTIFIIISLALSSMQVGLATTSLQQSPAFVNTSYGFAIASLAIVLLFVFLAAVAVAWRFINKVIRPWMTRSLIGSKPGRDW